MIAEQTMTTEQVYVKMALSGWESSIKRVDALFNGLTDEQLMGEIAPGRNRGIYLLGHLTAVHDAMPVILGLGESRYPGLRPVFLDSPDKAGLEMPSIATLRGQWAETNSRLTGLFSNLQPAEWFQRHMSVSPEDFAKEPWRNRLNVLLGRTVHLASHQGQLVLLKK
jgi:hypothetical protein